LTTQRVAAYTTTTGWRQLIDMRLRALCEAA
jgi:hypothetical protein